MPDRPRPTHDHVGNFNFKVEIDGLTPTTFWIGAEQVNDGRLEFNGKNGRPLSKTFGNITLKKGYLSAHLRNDWNVLTSGGNRNRYQGWVVQYNRSGDEIARWYLDNAWPQAWKPGKSTFGGVAIEELTLACERIEFRKV
ncbi:MAG: phage tail protein [Candidatus Eisenbacteria bacterium]|uniref:Phage tail protein n=1 Tax=Eiseniibacteriota bacterium TaxID=2212470 RepID=A0A7Y2EDK0_UNCEI|nr:phage tail protein [Candidatus Eisenbacteria bacterium]